MSVPAKAFQQWLHAAAPDVSSAEIARRAGIKRSTLAQQLVRGKVALGTVVAVSRALELDVLAALSGFDRYRDLATDRTPPSGRELLSQIADLDLLQEILWRNSTSTPLADAPLPRLSPPPHRSSVRWWVDAIDSGDLRQRLAKDLDMAPQNISTQITANRLPPAVAVQAARIAGVGLAGSLVVAGLLTPEEAQWPQDARELALRRLPDSELTALASIRLDALSRSLRRAEQDNEQTKALWENLG
ncbi:MAG: hypothetical protein JWO93_953 [Micrococcaceae bacterium]|nr:hypothetical protein [Micrococcaceae bacterium]